MSARKIRSYKSYIYVMIAILSSNIATSPTFAQHSNAGNTAFPFLNINYDARSIAMGGANVAMPNDMNGILANPAAVGFTTNENVIAAYRQIILDMWGGVLGVSLPLDTNNTWIIAPTLITLSSGSFDVVDESGVETGNSASSAFTALGFTLARKINNNFSVGATVKGAYHNIGTGEQSYAAVGFAIDAGVQYRMRNNQIIYGAALRNFGVMRGYFGDWNEYPMPYGFEAGVSYIPRHIPNLRAALDVNIYNGDYMNFEPAFEYSIIRNVLFVRGGYSFSSMDLEKTLDVFRGDRDDNYSKSNINSLSLGFGLATQMDGVNLKLDAALQLYSDITSPALAITVAVGF